MSIIYPYIHYIHQKLKLKGTLIKYCEKKITIIISALFFCNKIIINSGNNNKLLHRAFKTF